MYKRVSLFITAVVCAFLCAPPSAHARSAKDCANWLLAQARPFITLNAFKENRIRTVFSEVSEFWEEEFARRGWPFVSPKLVLYSRGISSACDEVLGDQGPIYCPKDHSVYIDRRFFKVHTDKVGRPSEGLLNYVIGHEIAHHVQKLRRAFDITGFFERRPDDPEFEKRVSAGIELQADCLAGVAIAHRILHGQASRFITNTALASAELVGDDTQALVAKAKGRPYSVEYAHGLGVNRKKWLQIGLDSRSAEVCEPFSISILDVDVPEIGRDK